MVSVDGRAVPPPPAPLAAWRDASPRKAGTAPGQTVEGVQINPTIRDHSSKRGLS